MRAIALVAFATGSFLCAAPTYADAALILGSNLIVNGDAESPSNPGGGPVAITAWTSTAGGMTVVPYGTSGGFPAATDPGPTNRGSQFFAGGSGYSVSSITQLVSVADGAASIDAGTVNFLLSAYLGGFDGQDDFSALKVTFESAGNTVLGTSTISGPSSSSRGGQTGLFFNETNGSIPVGTRSLLFELDATRLQGNYNDGYADNLSFVAGGRLVQSVPEPISLSIVGIGLLGALAVRRRRA